MVVVSKAPPAPPVETSGAKSTAKDEGGVDIDVNGDDGTGGKTS
jgi:hypothetical protein